jgi:hypothetical protein
MSRRDCRVAIEEETFDALSRDAEAAGMSRRDFAREILAGYAHLRTERDQLKDIVRLWAAWATSNDGASTYGPRYSAALQATPAECFPPAGSLQKEHEAAKLPHKDRSEELNEVEVCDGLTLKPGDLVAKVGYPPLFVTGLRRGPTGRLWVGTRPSATTTAKTTWYTLTDFARTTGLDRTS